MKCVMIGLTKGASSAALSKKCGIPLKTVKNTRAALKDYQKMYGKSRGKRFFLYGPDEDW